MRSRKSHEETESHSSSATYNTGDIRVSRGYSYRRLVSSVQLCESKHNRECSVYILLTPPNNFTLHHSPPQSSALIFLVWSIIYQPWPFWSKMHSASCGSWSAPLPGPDLWSHHLSKEVRHIEKSWMQTRENWISFISTQSHLGVKPVEVQICERNKNSGHLHIIHYSFI